MDPLKHPFPASYDNEKPKKPSASLSSLFHNFFENRSNPLHSTTLEIRNPRIPNSRRRLLWRFGPDQPQRTGRRVLFATKPATPKVEQHDRGAERREIRSTAHDWLVWNFVVIRGVVHGPWVTVYWIIKGTNWLRKPAYWTFVNDFCGEVRKYGERWLQKHLVLLCYGSQRDSPDQDDEKRKDTEEMGESERRGKEDTGGYYTNLGDDRKETWDWKERKALKFSNSFLIWSCLGRRKECLDSRALRLYDVGHCQRIVCAGTYI